jgi:hypothetical protein
MKRLLFLLAIALMAAGLGRTPAQQGAPDPYPVTPQAGPWLICVASYCGDEAESKASPEECRAKANAFAEEVRVKYKTAAYVFNQGANERRKQYEEFEKIRSICPQAKLRIERIKEQFAVLIGGYPDMETARKALDKVRKWPQPSDRFCVLGERVVPGKSDKGEKGFFYQQICFSPFATAFVVRNPTLPREQEDKNADPFLWELNSGESLSLLKSSKPWTLVVKVYQGAAMLKPRTASSSFLDMIGMGSKTGELLNAGAMQAHELGQLLRKMKFDAYVLHTRSSSLVCVGGYDGKEDPRLLRDQQTLAKLHFQAQSGNPDPDSMRLLVQPLPMEVPHKP